MSDTRRRARIRAVAAGMLLLVLASCSTRDDVASDPTPAGTPEPTAEWGEWITVDEMVTPVGTVDDIVLVAGLGTSTVIAFERGTGDEQWRIGGDDSVGGSWTEPASAGNAVLFDDEHVYTQRASEDGALVAYDIADGSESWRYDPGELDDCAPTHTWSLSWSQVGTYEIGEHGRLFLSHPEMAAPGCHAGPNATHPGSPAMVIVDASTGEQEGAPERVSGTSIPGMTSPGLSSEYVYTPYELQGSVNIVRRSIETGDEAFAMLDYPADPSILEFSPSITDMGSDTFHIHYMGGGSVEARVDQWATDLMDMGNVSTNDLDYRIPCEYRMQRSASDQLYCLILTSSPDPDNTPAFTVGEVDSEQGVLRDGHPLEFPAVLVEDRYVGDEYYGIVTDPQTVAEDALIPAAMTGTEHNGVVLPSERGLAAFDLGSAEQRWSWNSDTGGVVAPHVVPGVDEVVIGLGETAVSLDARTGEQLWEMPTDGPVFGLADTIVVADFETSTTRVRTTVPLL